MAYCTGCGAPLHAGAQFCSECGLKVDQGDVPAPAQNAQQAPELHPAENAQPPDGFGSGRVEQARQAAQEVADLVKGQIEAPEQPGEFVFGTWSEGLLQTDPAGIAAASARAVSASSGRQPSQRKSKLPIVIGIAGAAVVVALLALYVVPLFVSHPHDPHEDQALTSSSSADASASASSAGASSSTAGSGSAASAPASSAAAAVSASSASAGSASGGSATSEPSGGATPASSEAAPPATSASYSTSERPKIGEFQWVTSEIDTGDTPAGASLIVDLGAVTGGWKAYMHGGNLERLLNVAIDAGQSGAQVTLDWYYIRDNGAGKVFEDTAANSTLTGSFEGGMLDASGPGRIMLTAFWEQDGRQYAIGSFIWPSGETEVIALVRP